jgi:dienelactone hydrolase
MAPSRRRVLQVLGSASVVAIAGCVGDSGDDGSDTGPNGSSPNASDETAPADETGSTDGTGTTGDGPANAEAAARQFVDHLFAEEYEAAQSLFTESVRGQATPAVLERMHLGYAAAGGEFRAIDGVETGVRSGLTTVTLSLQFERASASLRTSLTEALELRGAAMAGEYERASYVDPGSFEATEHTLDPGGCRLGATVTMPTDVDRAPGVVIVHGSGPADRDLTIGANEPYRDLAEGLSSRGIAVLRYDKRTHACNVPAAEYTVDRVTVEDAVHALSWFRERDAVESDDVSVLGHSLGAMMAPAIAARDGQIAGAIGLATPARPLTEIFLDQIDHLASVGEYTLSGVDEQRTQWQRAAEQIRNGNVEDDEPLLGFSGAFWRSLEGYDPVERADALSVPQHYLQGGRDYQVTVEDDFAEWQTAFADDPSVALSAYDPLNHVFLPGQGPSVPEAYNVPNEVHESVVEDLATWIRD